MRQRVIALVLLLVLSAATVAEACRDADCCLGLYLVQRQACYADYLSRILPPCMAALVACGCTFLIPIPSGCAIACLTASAACISALVTANAQYSYCLELASWRRDACLESLVAECV